MTLRKKLGLCKIKILSTFHSTDSVKFYCRKVFMPYGKFSLNPVTKWYVTSSFGIHKHTLHDTVATIITSWYFSWHAVSLISYCNE